jgi:hypothetical protein
VRNYKQETGELHEIEMGNAKKCDVDKVERATEIECVWEIDRKRRQHPCQTSALVSNDDRQKCGVT